MKKLFLLMAVLLISSGVMLGQAEAGQGTVAGNVSDPTKAVISGAHVVLSNPGIGYKKEVVTNSEGHFSFPSLIVVGGYSLTVTAKGFSTEVVKDFATSVGTVITQNVTLNVGAAGTTVEVAGGTIEQVQTDTSSISQVIDQQVMEQSPLLYRDSNQFVALTAGAASDSAGTGRGFAVNGARTGTGNFQLDGFDNNDQGLGGGADPLGSGSVTSISPDAIQEYRVISSVPNAEYGRAGGFVTDTVLKSGTNHIHGSVFEYNRIQALAQNGFFTNRGGLRSHLIFNQFGGGVGAPIIKDKTFFQGNVEFLRLRSGSPDTFTGITQAFYNFVKSGQYEQWMEGTAFQNGGTTPGFCPAAYGTTCPGKFADTATTGPVFNKEYNTNPAAYPFGTRNFSNAPTDLLGQLSGEIAPVNVYGDGTIIETSPENVYRGSTKIDHKLTNRDQLAFTYAVEIDSTTDNLAGGEDNPGTGEINYGGAQIFGSRWTHTFTPNLLNDFRAGYLRHVRNFVPASFPGVAATFVADTPSTGFGASSGLPQPFTENQFSYEDAASWTHHTHNYKFGFRFLRTRNGSSFYNDVNGTIGFWGSPGLLTDGLNEVDGERILDSTVTCPNCTTGAYHSAYGTLYEATASQDPSTGLAPDPYRGYRANEFAAYAQDDWKATPRLVVNYGLRWDYFGPPHNFRGGVDSNVYFGTATTVATTNPFAPGTGLYLGEQSASFRCVGFNPCGNPANAALNGYALASNTSTIWQRNPYNFGPRVGFAYDTFGNGKLVLRGGFGIGYDRLYNNVYENIRFNAPRFVDNSTGYGAGGAGVSETLRAGLVMDPFNGNSLLAGAGPVPRHVNQNLKTAYYEQMHFGVQTNILKGYVIEVNYIGTLGRQLVGLMNANTFEGRVACSTTAQKTACAAAGLTTAQMSTARPNAIFGNDNFRTNGFTSNYSAAQVSLRRGFSHGFQFTANYTYSKAMDEVSDVFTTKNGGTGIPTPYNPSHNYGPADYDQRHIFTLAGNYRSQSTTHKLLLAGWGFSPIFRGSSGTPIFVRSSSSTYDPNKDNLTGVEKAVYVGGGSLRNSINHANSPAGNGTSGTGFIKPGTWAKYTCPANVNSGLWCDVPGDRNILNGIRQYNLDVQASKEINIGERYKLILQAAFFDVDGHTEFGNPSGDLNSTSFGESTSAGGRVGQLSGRIEF